jgi:hypothetical protein
MREKRRRVVDNERRIPHVINGFRRDGWDDEGHPLTHDSTDEEWKGAAKDVKVWSARITVTSARCIVKFEEVAKGVTHNRAYYMLNDAHRRPNGKPTVADVAALVDKVDEDATPAA